MPLLILRFTPYTCSRYADMLPCQRDICASFHDISDVAAYCHAAAYAYVYAMLDAATC